MAVDKYQVLQGAMAALNRSEQPWQVTVEGDAIVARFRWMDATFFAPHEVSNETRSYMFTVTLGDNGRWKEVDQTEQKSTGISMSGGKLKIGGSSQSFIGSTSQKSVSFGIGRNNQSGQAGLIGFKFNTEPIKQAVRGYLTSCGWKKAGFFGWF